MTANNSSFDGFIMFMRSSDESIHRFPYVFNLLAVIARRAKRTEHYNNANLEIGEALLGDYEKYGMTEGQYRAAKKWLEKNNLVTFRTTSRGTIARLVDTSIFDINADQFTNEITGQQRTSNDQQTTNNNDKNEKMKKMKRRESRKRVGIEVLDDINFVNEMKEKFFPADIESEFEKIKDWQASKGTKIVDYKAFARNWLRRANPTPRGSIRIK